MTAPIVRAMEVSSGASYEELRTIGRMRSARFAQDMQRGGVAYALRNVDASAPKFNHAGHLFLVILTLGLWLPVYAIAYHYSDRAKWYRKYDARDMVSARISNNRRKNV